MPATAITVNPCVGGGALRRPIASHAREPIATSSSTRVGEGRDDRGALPAVRVLLIGPQLAGQRTAPREHQAGDIAEVVAGIGQQASELTRQP